MNQEQTELGEAVSIIFDTSRYRHLAESDFIRYAAELREKIEKEFPGGLEYVSGTKRMSTEEIRIEYLVDDNLITMIRKTRDLEGNYCPKFYVKTDNQEIADKLEKIRDSII